MSDDHRITSRKEFMQRAAAAGLTALFFPPLKLFPMDANPQGVISKPSKYSVKETIDRLQKILEGKGVTIFARIDQRAEAAKVGLELSPIELLIFGNPKAGTPLMKAVPLSALDLPLKALSWQDAEKQVWLSYNSAQYLQQRFSLPDNVVSNINVDPVIDLALQ
ncbi:MAG TPA: DUF302 domain-containing protein [Puia sp.]|nr:DUF302 domain-containing protein [Puia sp.]